ncbi:hypothetical protein PPROV_000303800 [Pycnococcus provasolii]|uniref:Uncharacterized protein n=1 Tax=Pycnococcus provasolii TaxID=41880 RepID=A0A830HB12_9CHLO|nr:hypothetical protein PPROV_000303800 [Pycnococcus provasolii]
MPVPFVHDDDELLPPPGGDVDVHVDLLPIAEPAQRKQAASRKRRAQVDSAATLPNGRIRPQVDSAATLPNATIRRNLEDTSFCTLALPENRERLGRSSYDMRALVLGTTSSFAPGAMPTQCRVERTRFRRYGGAPPMGTNDVFAPSPEYDDDDDAAPLTIWTSTTWFIIK